MANPGTQSNDDELCQELNKRTSLDWWQAWGAWFGYDSGGSLRAVLTDGEGGRYGCVVRDPLAVATGSVIDLAGEAGDASFPVA